MSDAVARYVAYLRSPEGRARSGRFWSALAPFLAKEGERRALDAGAGVGELSSRLALLGWRVTLLDPDEGMLAVARASPTAASYEMVCDGFDRARAWPSRFDLVACHLALEYASDPWSTLDDLARAIHPAGLLSLVVRTVDGEIEKQRARGDERAAERARDEHRFVNECSSQSGRLFVASETRARVEASGLRVVAFDESGRYLHVVASRPR